MKYRNALHPPVSVNQARNGLEDFGASLTFKLSHYLDNIFGISQESAVASEFFVFKQLEDTCRNLKVALGR